MNRRNLLQCTLVGATALLAGCWSRKFHALDITGADYARDFSLSDAQGRVRTLADFRGKVVVLFFGYVQCPDVCPTTMSTMKEVKTLLGKDGDRLQVLFITVDPERDTPAVMQAYMAAFDPSFIALIPTPPQLLALARDFKVYYKKAPGPTPTSYSMDHSAADYIYDPQGHLRLYVRFGQSAQDIAQDVKVLLS
ncbi:MAG: SCO family protein [Burkholderiaceae bacterium]|jgi:protein SCO1/2|nr:SCO family protein [Burkholderiaceae bacterium]